MSPKSQNRNVAERRSAEVALNHAPWLGADFGEPLRHAFDHERNDEAIESELKRLLDRIG